MQPKNLLSKTSDLRQSVEYGKYMSSLSWVVEGGVFFKKIPLTPFCFAKYQRPSLIEFEKLSSLFKKYKVILAVIEPGATFDPSVVETLKERGFRKSEPLLPSKTIWLDLRKSEEQLLKEMHPKTRYNIKKYWGEVEVVRGDKVSDGQIEDFYKIYKTNTKRQKFWGLKVGELRSLIKSFSRKAYLLKLKEGGLLVLVHDEVAYYCHNASSVRGKKEFVPTVLTWEAVRLAKRIGCKRFDFEGVEDKRFPVTKKWAGFSRFKKGFGGMMVEYIGSYSKWRFYDK